MYGTGGLSMLSTVDGVGTPGASVVDSNEYFNTCILYCIQ